MHIANQPLRQRDTLGVLWLDTNKGCRINGRILNQEKDTTTLGT